MKDCNNQLSATSMTNRLKAFPNLIVLLLLCTISKADDELESGGKSPNGRYEVRIYESGTDDSEPSNHYYGVFDTRKGKVIKTLDEGGGFCDYEGAIEMTKVLWNTAGDAFALIDHGTRHSMDLYINEVQGSQVRELRVPDHLKKALSLVGAKECYATSVVKLLTWNGNALTCSFIFDAETSTNRGPFYDTKFTITLRQDKKDGARITSIEKPVPEE